MEDIGFKKLDPDILEIDPVNERVSNASPHSLEGESLQESIRSQGVIEPVVVRPDNRTYKVVAGQRRTLAAQATDIGRIPARVMEMSDVEARVVSMTENAEEYKKEVPKEDRAKAVCKLIDDGFSPAEIAEEMGMSEPTIRRWLEPAQNYWEDTLFEAKPEERDDGEIGPEDISLRAMQLIRQNTSEKNRRERIATKIVEENVKNALVKEASEDTDSPEEFEQHIDQIIQELNSDIERVREEVHFSGQIAEELAQLTKERGIGEKEAIKTLVKKRLARLQKKKSNEPLEVSVDEDIVEALESVTEDSKVTPPILARAIVRNKLKETGYL